MKESLDYQTYRTLCILPTTCCRAWEDEFKKESKEEKDDDATPSVSIRGKKYKVDDTGTLDLNYRKDKFDGKIIWTSRLKVLKDIKQLRTLLMSGHGISYIGELPVMDNLQKLDLSCNRILGIEVLAGFTGLKELDLRDNKIMDISPLESLVNLESLWIDDNTRQNESYWLKVLLKLSSLKTLGIRKDGKDSIYQGKDEIKKMLLQRKKTCFQDITPPVIERTGSIKKEHSVTWTKIRFGSYSNWNYDKYEEEIKNGAWKEHEHYVIDRNGDYLWWGNSDERFSRKYRDVNGKYFFWGDVFWRVLDIKNGIALLMADEIFDVKQFLTTQEKNGLVAWENCELRRWLNDENGNSFYDSAFSENEKDAIVKKEDKVRLLKMDDIESHPEYGLLELYKNGKLFIDKMPVFRCKEYVKAKGLKGNIFSDNQVGAWWLGDLLEDKQKSIYVDEEGKLVKQGINADEAGIGIRPVIEVDLRKVVKSLQVEKMKVTVSTVLSIVM